MRGLWHIMKCDDKGVGCWSMQGCLKKRPLSCGEVGVGAGFFLGWGGGGLGFKAPP